MSFQGMVPQFPQQSPMASVREALMLQAIRPPESKMDKELNEAIISDVQMRTASTGADCISENGRRSQEFLDRLDRYSQERQAIVDSCIGTCKDSGGKLITDATKCPRHARALDDKEFVINNVRARLDSLIANDKAINGLLK